MVRGAKGDRAKTEGAYAHQLTEGVVNKILNGLPPKKKELSGGDQDGAPITRETKRCLVEDCKGASHQLMECKKFLRVGPINRYVHCL
jgi:hypothetical protein